MWPAPWDPQKETTNGWLSSSPRRSLACSRSRVKNSPRTGVPVTATRLASL